MYAIYDAFVRSVGLNSVLKLKDMVDNMIRMQVNNWIDIYTDYSLRVYGCVT